MSPAIHSIDVALLALAFAGLCQALYLAPGQALLPERSPQNILIAALYSGVALIFLDVLLVVDSPPLLRQNLPALEFWFALSRFLLGPLAFAYFGFMIPVAADSPPPASAAKPASVENLKIKRARKHLAPGLCLMAVGSVLLAMYAAGLLGQRYPRFLQSLRLEARRLGRRRENRLRNLSAEQLQRSMDELMQNEKIYQDEDLRLSTVAALLDVTPHQLSYYLNQVLRIDFATYINQYRVRAVEEVLRSPDSHAVPVLEIGFAAGFNSRTAFYRAFGEATGMSPSKYRERFRGAAKNTDT